MKPNYDYRKDFFGKSVLVGEEVVITEPRYHNFIRGIITKFTPKGVKVKYTNANGWEKETFCFNGEFIFVESKYRELYKEEKDD